MLSRKPVRFLKESMSNVNDLRENVNRLNSEFKNFDPRQFLQDFDLGVIHEKQSDYDPSFFYFLLTANIALKEYSSYFDSSFPSDELSDNMFLSNYDPFFLQSLHSFYYKHRPNWSFSQVKMFSLKVSLENYYDQNPKMEWQNCSRKTVTYQVMKQLPIFFHFNVHFDDKDQTCQMCAVCVFKPKDNLYNIILLNHELNQKMLTIFEEYIFRFLFNIQGPITITVIKKGSESKEVYKIMEYKKLNQTVKHKIIYIPPSFFDFEIKRPFVCEFLEQFKISKNKNKNKEEKQFFNNNLDLSFLYDVLFILPILVILPFFNNNNSLSNVAKQFNFIFSLLMDYNSSFPCSDLLTFFDKDFKSVSLKCVHLYKNWFFKTEEITKHNPLVLFHIVITKLSIFPTIKDSKLLNTIDEHKIHKDTFLDMLMKQYKQYSRSNRKELLRIYNKTAKQYDQTEKQIRNMYMTNKRMMPMKQKRQMSMYGTDKPPISKIIRKLKQSNTLKLTQRKNLDNYEQKLRYLSSNLKLFDKMLNQPNSNKIKAPVGKPTPADPTNSIRRTINHLYYKGHNRGISQKNKYTLQYNNKIEQCNIKHSQMFFLILFSNIAHREFQQYFDGDENTKPLNTLFLSNYDHCILFALKTYYKKLKQASQFTNEFDFSNLHILLISLDFEEYEYHKYRMHDAKWLYGSDKFFHDDIIDKQLPFMIGFSNHNISKNESRHATSAVFNFDTYTNCYEIIYFNSYEDSESLEFCKIFVHSLFNQVNTKYRFHEFKPYCNRRQQGNNAFLFIEAMKQKYTLTNEQMRIYQGSCITYTYDIIFILPFLVILPFFRYTKNDLNVANNKLINDIILCKPVDIHRFDIIEKSKVFTDLIRYECGYMFTGNILCVDMYKNWTKYRIREIPNRILIRMALVDIAKSSSENKRTFLTKQIKSIRTHIYSQYKKYRNTLPKEYRDNFPNKYKRKVHRLPPLKRES